MERTIQSFMDKDFDVIICTTIIESGIDMPNVNTIIVEDADRLGLASAVSAQGQGRQIKPPGICIFNI